MQFPDSEFGNMQKGPKSKLISQSPKITLRIRHLTKPHYNQQLTTKWYINN